MSSGYNQVILIGRVVQNIEIKPYMEGVKIRFYLEVEDLDFDPVYAKYKRHKEIFRIVFLGNNYTPYDFILSGHRFVQVTGKLHIRTFKERMMSDKKFSVEIKSSKENILLLDTRNNGQELLTSLG
ncbi:MAG: single-stranded DNA-binding protein [Succinivibrio dextrinosolvens]|nr:single-stranded DNA-binding protein [Succinivibrio dextrinosolvens]